MKDGDNLRTVIESERFKKERTEVEPNCQRFDEAFKGINWALARKPEKGRPTNVAHIYGLPIQINDDQHFVVYYTFDDNTVTLISIQSAMPDNEG